VLFRSGDGSEVLLATRTAQRTVRGTLEVLAIADEVKRLGAKLLIADPAVEFHEAEENDNTQMRTVYAQFRKIAQKAGCAVTVASHTKKPPKASSDGFSEDIDSNRGGSAQIGVIRNGALLFPMGEKEASKWGVAKGDHRKYVRLFVAKNNLGPKSEAPIWYKFETVTVGEDRVGVLRLADLKFFGAKSSSDLLELIARALRHKVPCGDKRKLNAIVDLMDAADVAQFPDKTHRPRDVGNAFGDDTVLRYPTNYGLLVREKQNQAWLYSLDPVSKFGMPAERDEVEPDFHARASDVAGEHQGTLAISQNVVG
jgi:hypothetical protein